MKDSFDLERLRREIKPFRLHFFPTLSSTNSHAAKLRKRGELFLPAVVLTGRQTAGRGRGRNTWFSDRGCLTVTFALPVEHQLLPNQLPLVVGLALRNAAAELTGHAPIQIKWPNDLLFEGKKLAGILCERVENADLVGIGLNVNLEPEKAPKALRGAITSLAEIAGGGFDMTSALVTVAGHLRRMLKDRRAHTFASFRGELDSHLALVGRRVKVVEAGDERKIVGQCAGIDFQGRLLVREGNHVHKIIAGHVLAV